MTSEIVLKVYSSWWGNLHNWVCSEMANLILANCPIFQVGITFCRFSLLKQEPEQHQIPEIPKFIWIGFVLDVTKAIGVSSYVAHPNIKSCVSQKEGKTLIRQIGDPVGWSTQQAMLEEHYLLWWTSVYVTWVFHSPWRYSLNVEKVTILCLNCVFLCWVSMVTNNLGLQKECVHG